MNMNELSWCGSNDRRMLDISLMSAFKTRYQKQARVGRTLGANAKA